MTAPDNDPLHLLTGLTPAAANALAALGITRFDQVHAMTDLELAGLASGHAALEPLRWREVRDELRIDARMRSTPAVSPSMATRDAEKRVGRAALPESPTTPPDSPVTTVTTVTTALDVADTRAGEPEDALTALDGIDAVAARQLRQAGIRTFRAVASLEQDGFDDLARRFLGLRKFSWPFWQDKLRAQAAALAGTQAPTSGACAANVPGAGKETVREKLRLAGERASQTRERIGKVANEVMHVVGGGTTRVRETLKEARELASESAQDAGALAARAGHALSETARQLAELIRAEFHGEDVYADDQLGVLYKSAPQHPDDLSAVEGISDAAAQELQQAGIHTFRQIAHLGDAAAASLATRFPVLAGIAWEAARASAGKLSGHPMRSAVTKAADGVMARAGELAEDARQTVAHLAETAADPARRGAALAKGREELREASEMVRHAAEKAGGAARKVANDLHARAEELQDKWSAARRETSGEEAAAPASDGAAKLSLATRARLLGDFLEARVNGDKVNADEAGGFRYRQAPRDADDLTRLAGLEAGHAGFLNAHGIYKIRQIAKWTDANIHNIARKEPALREHDLRLWRADARVAAPSSGFRNAWNRVSDTARSTVRYYFKNIPAGFAGEDVEVGPYGTVYISPPGTRDALERITGISPEIAARLNRIGVFRFKQVAGWSIRTQRNVAERIALPATADIASWVAQAGRLAG